jgi:hypothetical protein
VAVAGEEQHVFIASQQIQRAFLFRFAQAVHHRFWPVAENRPLPFPGRAAMQ